MDSSPINNACKLSSDAWSELQALRTRQLNRREKLNRHKREREDLVRGIEGNQYNATNTDSNCQPIRNSHRPHGSSLARISSANNGSKPHIDCSSDQRKLSSASDAKIFNTTNGVYIENQLLDCLELEKSQLHVEAVECLLLQKLCDVALKLPIDSRCLRRALCKYSKSVENTSQPVVEDLLQKFAHQELITIEESLRPKLETVRMGDNDDADEFCIIVTSADHTKLSEFGRSLGTLSALERLTAIYDKNGDVNCDNSTRDKKDSQRPDDTYHHFVIEQQRVQKQEQKQVFYQYCQQSDSVKQTDDPNLDGKPNHPAIDTTSNNSANPSKTNVNSIGIGDDVESLLSLASTREKESKKLGEELLELLSKPTAKEQNLLERFRSADGYQVQEFCPKGTKEECKRVNKRTEACHKLHFKKIISKHTDESLGDCSFLNTCFHMDSCKYVHYEVDYNNYKYEFKRLNQANNASDNSNINGPEKGDNRINSSPNKGSSHWVESSISLPAPASDSYDNQLTPEHQAALDVRNKKRFKTVLYPPQWIQCDLRFFDMSLLGKFSVVMADPPWDIHMELPYGTMSDDEMRKLNIPSLQDDGIIFLWVTGRAMELGRECLALWGYERCDEIIWVKTNQLQRIIRTGRTGHWLNHGKEHCLVGIKGNPKDINRGLDCDVIVAEVRATSHKPDEIYGIIERLSPGTRKIELFGRPHNVQPNWITLGNQLNGVRLIEPSLVNAFKKLNYKLGRS